MRTSHYCVMFVITSSVGRIACILFRVARSPVFDRDPPGFWYKIWLKISLITTQVKVRFTRDHLALCSSITQNLATFKKILFTKGGFSGIYTL